MKWRVAMSYFSYRIFDLFGICSKGITYYRRTVHEPMQWHFIFCVRFSTDNTRITRFGTVSILILYIHFWFFFKLALHYHDDMIIGIVRTGNKITRTIFGFIRGNEHFENMSWNIVRSDRLSSMTISNHKLHLIHRLENMNMTGSIFLKFL